MQTTIVKSTIVSRLVLYGHGHEGTYLYRDTSGGQTYEASEELDLSRIIYMHIDSSGVRHLYDALPSTKFGAPTQRKQRIMDELRSLQSDMKRIVAKQNSLLNELSQIL